MTKICHVRESLYPRNLIFTIGVRESLSPQKFLTAKPSTFKVVFENRLTKNFPFALRYSKKRKRLSYTQGILWLQNHRLVNFRPSVTRIFYPFLYLFIYHTGCFFIAYIPGMLITQRVCVRFCQFFRDYCPAWLYCDLPYFIGIVGFTFSLTSILRKCFFKDF